MATDFWSSSHCKRWLVDRAIVGHARLGDLAYATEDQLALLGIFFANVISKLGKKLQLKQRAIATATVFFRRFYLKNSYCETDPFIVATACCYVASKAEETPVHVKTAVLEARTLFGSDEYSIKNFPSDNSKLAEMEFYLVDDLECDLVVFHPYRTLLALCGKEVGTMPSSDTEAGEVGVGVDEGPRYWGTGDGKLEIHDSVMQIAWFIINDSYRSDLCLLYPPHLIAIAAVYLALLFHKSTRQNVLSAPSRRSSRHSNAGSEGSKRVEDPISFLAGLNVPIPRVATIIQEIISLYTLWSRFKEEAILDSAHHLSGARKKDKGKEKGKGRPLNVDTSGEITTSTMTQLVIHMREQKEADMAHPPSTGRAVAINKVIERAQIAG